MGGDEVSGAALLQLLLALLRVAPRDDSEPQLVQVPGQEVPEARVAARDVHKLVGLVRDPGLLSEPTEQVEENHQSQKIQEHVCGEISAAVRQDLLLGFSSDRPELQKLLSNSDNRK